MALERGVFLERLPREAECVFRVMEAAGLRALGAYLQRVADRFPDPYEIRKIGNVLIRVADTRMEYLAGRRQEKPADDQVHAANDWDKLMWQIQRPGLIPDELLGSIVTQITESLSYLDERASDGGITGDGWYRTLVKGT